MEAVDSFLYLLEKFLEPTASLQEILSRDFPTLVDAAILIVLIVTTAYYTISTVTSSLRLAWLMALVFIVIPYPIMIFMGEFNQLGIALMLIGLLTSKWVVCVGGFLTGQWSIRHFSIFILVVALAFVAAKHLQDTDLVWIPLVGTLIFSTLQVGLVWIEAYSEESRVRKYAHVSWMIVIVFAGLLLEPFVVAALDIQLPSSTTTEYGYIDYGPFVLWAIFRWGNLLNTVLSPLFPVFFSIGLLYEFTKPLFSHNTSD